MAQSALDGIIDLPANQWILLSEGNCTFQPRQTEWFEVRPGSGSTPSDTSFGLYYQEGLGEVSSTDVLSWFPGTTTRTHVWAISRGQNGKVYVNRPAVA